MSGKLQCAHVKITTIVKSQADERTPCRQRSAIEKSGYESFKGYKPATGGVQCIQISRQGNMIIVSGCTAGDILGVIGKYGCFQDVIPGLKLSALARNYMTLW